MAKAAALWTRSVLAADELKYLISLRRGPLALEGFQIISRDWRYLYVNPAAARHGRRAPEELFGRRMSEVYPGIDETPLFDGVFKEGERAQVWMSHGDRVTRLPPGFRAVGISTGAPFAAIADDSRRLYGVQFHPEVVHTPKGAALLRNFVRNIAGCPGDWTMAHFRESEVARIREQVGDSNVVCGLSGGVDSSVAALLIHEAIGDQLTCIFVDHGLLREGEAREVVDLFRGHYNIPLVHVQAQKLFLEELAGVVDPVQKRKIIGKLFIDIDPTFTQIRVAQGDRDLIEHQPIHAIDERLLEEMGEPLGGGCSVVRILQLLPSPPDVENNASGQGRNCRQNMDDSETRP